MVILTLETGCRDWELLGKQIRFAILPAQCRRWKCYAQRGNIQELRVPDRVVARPDMQHVSRYVSP